MKFLREFWAWRVEHPGRMAIVIAVAVILGIGVIASLSGGGGSDAPSARPARPLQDITTPQDSRQIAYERFLAQARSDVARDPDLNCDPDYQQLVIDQVTSATGAQKVLIQFAMGDACIEAGEWEGGVYSSYHR